MPTSVEFGGIQADDGYRPLSLVEAELLFRKLAAKRDLIPFDFLREGCEVRSQLMIDQMVALGINPGRAWALAAPGKFLSVPNPRNPRQAFRWVNHTAPTIAVSDRDEGIRVIDPSLPGVSGPLRIEEWAMAFKLNPFEKLTVPLTQAEMLATFAERTMRGQTLKGFVIVVERGRSPVADIPGSGFRIAADPPEGVDEFVRSELRRLFLASANEPG